jgi:hypothetical protein
MEGIMHSVRPSRRWLIAAGAACFAGMTPAALAQDVRRARQSGRPLFTAEALNRMIPAPSDRNHRAFLLDAANDIRAFVRSRFTLTAQQEAELARIPDNELAGLQAMLRRAAANRDGVRIDIGSEATSSAARRFNPDVEERARDAQERLSEEEGQGKLGRVARTSGGRVVEQSTLHLGAAALRPAETVRERASGD